MRERSTGLIVAHHRAAVRVEADARPLEDRRDCGPGAAREGLDAGDELGKGERLGEVVVGPEPEAGDALGDGGCCREHQDAGLRLGLDQRRADLVARDDRQVAVEHQHVVVVDARPLEAGLAVIGDVHCHRVEPQAFRDRVRELPLVFDDQYAHVVTQHQRQVA